MQQFKVGDWVSIDGCNYYVHEEHNGNGNISKDVVNNLYTYGRDVELWQPKQGEWCWSKTRNKLTDNVCELIRFYWDNSDKIYECEPFIGELPSFLKDPK